MRCRKTIGKAIFLDLDGVLFDTVREAYCICALAQNRAKSIEDVDFESGHFKIFKKYRFLITCAGDYYDLLKSIDKAMKDKKLDIAKEYRHQVKRKSNSRKSFEKSFLKNRGLVKRNHYKYWISLNRPYDFLHRLFEILKDKKSSLFVITTKDKDSVLRLFAINGIELPKENIYDWESHKKFKSKGNIIKHIKEEYGIKKSLFVDDSREHLRSCRGIRGLETAHAAWGYVSQRRSPFSEEAVLNKIKHLLGD